MTEDNDIFIQAYNLWSNFKKEVVYKNRFIINHEVLDYLEEIANACKTTIESGRTLYRARIYIEDDNFVSATLPPPGYRSFKQREQSGFLGYSAEESFVPPYNDLINDGRANPAFIKYLYTAEEPYTALVEVRHFLGSRVSVADIKINEPLVVANFSYESIEILNDVKKALMYLIMKDFSNPNDSDLKKNIPSQYIAEYIKTLGFDGIRFNSSLHTRGRNITILNFKNCYPERSKLYEIKDIYFEAKAVSPVHEQDLIHWKLESHREQRRIVYVNPSLKKKNETLILVLTIYPFLG